MVHIQFATGADADLCLQIALRVVRESSARAFNDMWSSVGECVMDLSATHANGCALKLRDMLNGRREDLMHDAFGIGAHIDRSTGKLGGCFLPRYADMDAIKAA